MPQNMENTVYCDVKMQRELEGSIEYVAYGAKGWEITNKPKH